MRTAIYDRLSGDTTLMALLPGGLHTDTGISRSETPAAFDANGELQTCALLRLETDTPTGPYANSSRLFFVLNLYDRNGYTTLDAVRVRIFQLLHRQPFLPATGGGCWDIVLAGELLDRQDTVLNCPLQVVRYAATISRSES